MDKTELPKVLERDICLTCLNSMWNYSLTDRDILSSYGECRFCGSKDKIVLWKTPIMPDTPILYNKFGKVTHYKNSNLLNFLKMVIEVTAEEEG